MRFSWCASFLVIASFACDPAPAPEPPAPTWRPEVTFQTPDAANARGFFDRRGLVHAHSVYSGDACDDAPVLEDGTRDPVCFNDFRRGVCQSGHDFIFLTDHQDAFASTEYPEALLFREERGDVLESGGNRFGDCEGRAPLLMGGSEDGTLILGLDEHIAADIETREAVYGSRETVERETLRSAGAVLIQEHIEDRSIDELSEEALHGFEMYNLHANLFVNLGPALDLALRIANGDPEVAHPDLLAIHMISEDPRYLEKWSAVLARGHQKVTTMGTDCHRNALQGITEDGERIDSYRRMMRMFSNHLLVTGESADEYKAALVAGRLYGAFELFGYPVGFDYFATSGGEIREMGATVNVGDALTVRMPRVQDLDPEAVPPDLQLRILKATEEGFVVVAEGREDSLSHTVTEPGAYRAEVRIVPHHLTEFLRADALLLERVSDWVWIYANPIYAR